MNNFLESGAVLPHGLLGCSQEDFARGFNKTYKNTALRMGVITKAYAVGDSGNISRLTTEYDVTTIQQDENRGASSTTYRNCMSSEGMGSIADFFEKNLRIREKLDIDTALMDFKGQNGAVVLILCLDALSERALIIGSLTHPDRKTTLVSTEPYLEGEYNGVNVKIDTDGSASLTFNGATDNYGIPINPSAGPTEFKIEKDGSFQFNHSTVTIRADKSGALTINAKADATITVGGNCNATVSGDTNVTTTGITTVKSDKICFNGNSEDPLAGITSSQSHQQVIDLITGVPVQPSLTVFMDEVV